jgi:hypothetical protein
LTCDSFRFITIPFLLACLTAGGRAQSDSSTASPAIINPEDGFVSTSKYTNAFFGFSLPLPHDLAYREFRPSFKGKPPHFLFGLQSLSKGPFGGNVKLTLLTVTAEQTSSASREEVQKAASGPKEQPVTQIEIGGKEFWKRDFQGKVREGDMRSVAFATALNGYV